MTTSVTITTHSWPVRVAILNPAQPAENPEVRRFGRRGTHALAVHSGADLLIHEIQPGEADYDDPIDETLPQANSEEALAGKIVDAHDRAVDGIRHQPV